jgi:hypothetical protein
MAGFRGFSYLCATCTLLVLAVPSAASLWENATVDTLTRTQVEKHSVPQALDLDSSEHVHIVWVQKFGRIFYSTNSPDGEWLPQEEITDSTESAHSPALIVSSVTDQPCVAYQMNSGSDSEIHVACLSQGEWITERLTFNSVYDVYPSIAVDDLGNVHISWVTDYAPTGEYEIVYALGNLGDWDIQVLTGSHLGDYGTGARPFVAVSSEGIAHIAYRGGNFWDYHVHHAWNESLGDTNWQYEVMYSDNSTDEAHFIAVEGDGHLHLVLAGAECEVCPAHMHYRHKPPGEIWSWCELVSSDYSASCPRIDIDGGGVPHVVWCELDGNFYTGNIYSSSRVGSDIWEIELVVGEDATDPSFKIDSMGNGHLAYDTGANSMEYDIYHVHGAALASVPGGRADDQNLHSKYLSENLPNPFTDLATVHYLVPEDGLISLKVYSVRGREVAVLAEGFRQSGRYTAAWNARGVPPGIYFYRLEAGSVIQTRKCILLE